MYWHEPEKQESFADEPTPKNRVQWEVKGWLTRCGLNPGAGVSSRAILMVSMYAFTTASPSGPLCFPHLLH